jgi:hypothetical protein
VHQRLFVYIGRALCLQLLLGERNRIETLLAYQFQQIARMFPTDKPTLCSACTQGIGQRQAAHYMAVANLK